MSHELEQDDKGNAAFVSLRVPGWHKLGTVLKKAVSTKAMLKAGFLNDWGLRLERADLPYECYRDYYYVVRNSPFNGEPEILGVVGERYNVLQNEELFDFGDALLDGGGRWETAGSIKHGTVVFASLAVEREIVVDPTGVADQIKNYLLLNTSHDGSVAVQASVTPVRVVCQNTLNMALRGVKQTYKVRHTQQVKGKIAAARQALDLADAYFDRFEEEATALYQTPVTPDQFGKMIKTLYPEPKNDSKIAATKYGNKVDALQNIYVGETNHMIAGTAWGALNALTEHLDWFRTGRGDFAEENLAAARSGFDPVINAQKGKVLKVVKQVAGVKA